MPCSRTGSTSAAGTACGPAAGDQGQTNAESQAAVYYCDNIKWCDGTACPQCPHLTNKEDFLTAYLTDSLFILFI